MTKEQFEKLSPFSRGYCVYMYGARDDFPNIPDEECPYPKKSKKAGLWYDGQRQAYLDVLDTEE